MLKKDQIEFIKELYNSLSDSRSDGESASEVSKVLLKGIKDTELPVTSQIKNQDIISLVQNGENRTISYSNLKKEMADIVELSDITVDYGVSTSLSNIPTAYVSNVADLGTLTSKYLWTRIKYIFQGGSSKYIHIPVYIAKDGAKGDNGSAGKDGIPGVSVKSPSQRMIYISKPEGTVPTKPASGTGYWNTDTNTFTPPAEWSATNNGMSPVVWFSTGTMLPMGTVDAQGWSEPSRMTGEKGEDGKDSASAEYIYCLTATTKQLPPNPSNNPDVDDYVPENWSDQPKGISEEYMCEWVCTRTKDPDTGKWSDFSTPKRWATWGIDGKDGDGVEYIFCRTDVGSKPVCPKDNKDVDEYLPSDALVDAEGNNLDLNGLSGGWTDDPSDLTSIYRWLWCTKRKQTIGDDGQAHWGPFGGDNGWVALWGLYGENGKPGPEGNHTEYRYTATDDSTNAPVVNKTDKNPGSAWQTSIPTDRTKVIWAIEAVFNYLGNLIGEWSNPYIKSGIKGEAGTAPNYSNVAYIKAATKPNKPSNNSAKYPSGWVEYPTSTDDDEGRWWQCTALIQGSSKPEIALSWGEVGPVFGHDGNALTGDTYEERFTYWNDNTESNRPPVSALSSNPGDRWTLLSPTHISGESTEDYIYVWKVIAKIDASGNPITQQVEVNGSFEERKWGIPFCISGARGPVGETGPAGEKGPNGINGTPGVSFKVLTCLGSETAPNPLAQTITAGSKVKNPTGWYLPKDCPDPTFNTEYPYVWYIQCHVTYETQTDKNNDNYTIEDGWSTPARLTGVKGLPGDKGGQGQLIYPAGIYSEDKTYTCDERKAPYVFVPGAGSDGKGAFYVMNYIGTWNGKQQTQSIQQATTDDNTKWWVEFEGFEAIYTDILIARQSLIGSAVFDTNGFMFSQQGKDRDGNTTNKYQYFNPLNKENPYDYTEEEVAKLEDGQIFYPNFCINFMTGQIWYSEGQVNMSELKHYISDIETPEEDTVHFLSKAASDGFKSGLVVYDNLLRFKSGDTTSGVTMDITPERLNFIGRQKDKYNVQHNIPILSVSLDGAGTIAAGNIAWDSEGYMTFKNKAISSYNSSTKVTTHTLPTVVSGEYKSYVLQVSSGKHKVTTTNQVMFAYYNGRQLDSGKYAENDFAFTCANITSLVFEVSGQAIVFCESADTTSTTGQWLIHIICDHAKQSGTSSYNRVTYISSESSVDSLNENARLSLESSYAPLRENSSYSISGTCLGRYIKISGLGTITGVLNIMGTSYNVQNNTVYDLVYSEIPFTLTLTSGTLNSTDYTINVTVSSREDFAVTDNNSTVIKSITAKKTTEKSITDYVSASAEINISLEDQRADQDLFNGIYQIELEDGLIVSGTVQDSVLTFVLPNVDIEGTQLQDSNMTEFFRIMYPNAKLYHESQFDSEFLLFSETSPEKGSYLIADMRTQQLHPEYILLSDVFTDYYTVDEGNDVTVTYDYMISLISNPIKLESNTWSTDSGEPLVTEVFTWNSSIKFPDNVDCLIIYRTIKGTGLLDENNNSVNTLIRSLYIYAGKETVENIYYRNTGELTPMNSTNTSYVFNLI